LCAGADRGHPAAVVAPGFYNAAMDQPVRTTLRDIRQWARSGRKFAMLTCYDATTARWLYDGGLRVMLVGDSAGQVILGHDSTIHAPLEFMLQITAAVKRGAPGAFVMGDMPFMSYQADDAEAVRNAGRFMLEGRADAVKLEVDARYTDLVAKLSRASIPVVAHIGWRPQRSAVTGTAVVAGRTEDKIAELVDLAEVLEAQGASMLLIEASTAEAADRIVRSVNIPVIGCGAGPSPHGHVIILQDLLGMTDWQPAFAPPVTDLGRQIADHTRKWVQLVESGNYLADGGPYRMSAPADQR
jgi:3-methyl-2-oxobutanoate hydroxymethyltransferase